MSLILVSLGLFSTLDVQLTYARLTLQCTLNFTNFREKYFLAYARLTLQCTLKFTNSKLIDTVTGLS